MQNVRACHHRHHHHHCCCGLELFEGKHIFHLFNCLLNVWLYAKARKVDFLSLFRTDVIHNDKDITCKWEMIVFKSRNLYCFIKRNLFRIHTFFINPYRYSNPSRSFWKCKYLGRSTTWLLINCKVHPGCCLKKYVNIVRCEYHMHEGKYDEL